MSLSDHLDRMQQACASVTQQHRGPLVRLFCSGLLALQEYRADYDRIVDDQNPFYKEFTLSSKQDDISVDEIFSLFECLVLFIRMRQMASPHITLSTNEQQVLEYFETCGEWTDSDDSMVCRWYWQRLPAARCTH